MAHAEGIPKIPINPFGGLSHSDLKAPLFNVGDFVKSEITGKHVLTVTHLAYDTNSKTFVYALQARKLAGRLADPAVNGISITAQEHMLSKMVEAVSEHPNAGEANLTTSSRKRKNPFKSRKAVWRKSSEVVIKPEDKVRGMGNPPWEGHVCTIACGTYKAETRGGIRSFDPEEVLVQQWVWVDDGE